MAEQQWNEIVTLIEDSKKDASKFFEKGNKTAGTRIRKVLLDLKTRSHELRKLIQSEKNSMPPKKSVSVDEVNKVLGKKGSKSKKDAETVQDA